jgi:hypothetical protein
MKTRFLLYLTVLSMVFTAAKATEGEERVKKVNAKPNLVLEAFIDANIYGDAPLFKDILADNMTLRINRPKSVLEQDKDYLVKYYKKNTRPAMNCTGDYQILSRSDASVMAKVNLRFPTFVQQNYVLIEKDKNGAWQITQVNRYDVKS